MQKWREELGAFPAILVGRYATKSGGRTSSFHSEQHKRSTTMKAAAVAFPCLTGSVDLLELEAIGSDEAGYLHSEYPMATATAKK
jgi:hypothetical protein